MHAGDNEKDGQSGLTFPGIFALVANAYMHEHGLTRDELSAVSACSHRAAISNPYAQFRREIPIHAISKSTLVADPLRLLDCSPITDGAAAIILSTKTPSPVRIAASEIASDSLSLTERESLTSFPATKKAFLRAMNDANCVNDDIEYIELHDCFSIASLIHLEDMNFAEKGSAIRLFLDGSTESTGDLPINASGGLKACGHPIGATGIKQILDCYKQLTGTASNQVKHVKRALAHNLGGVGATCTVHILESLV
jgi:acetyl-CoA C-acetyltransferase